MAVHSLVKQARPRGPPDREFDLLHRISVLLIDVVALKAHDGSATNGPVRPGGLAIG
jgi:hypothetical protein